MQKEVKFAQDARQDLIDGVNIVANAVKATLGAKGRNVVIRRSSGDIHITKDGVTVAEEIFLKDKAKDIGAQIIKQAARKTASAAGDGTTTATVLAQYLVNQGAKSIAAGANPTEVKKGMEEALNEVLANLKSMATPVNRNIRSIATISANNDVALGSIIADAFESVGEGGVVTMEKSKTDQTYYTVSEGMEYTGGFISPYFINNPKKMNAELISPLVLVHEGEIGDIRDLLPILEPVIKASRSLVIVCEDMFGSALDSILSNTHQGRIKAVVCGAPSFGEDRKLSLEDIAIVTGATFISKESGIRTNEITFDMLGECEKVIVNNSHTTYIGGKGDAQSIAKRKEDIRAAIKVLEEPTRKEQYNQRLAKMQNGVAVVHVGALTEVELKERIDRVEDAIYATRAAIEEGVVVGGGVALIRAAQAVSQPKEVEQDILTGWRIVLSACEQPLVAIVENAGANGSIIVGNVLDNKGSFGYNVKTEKFGDLMEEGVIDPVKVTRTAFENAVSVASMILTTEVSIVDME